MDTRTEARSAGRRRISRVAAFAGAAALMVGLTACQTVAQANRDAITGPEPRPIVAAPQGIDHNLSADRIVEALERRQTALAERFAGVPADRIEETLAREECAGRLITSGYAYGAAQAASLCATGAPQPNAAD